MYDDDTIRIPANLDELWKILWEQFVFVRHVLWELPVETKEDALKNAYHYETEHGVNRNTMGVVRYRDIDGELGQRDYFLEMGRELLPYIHQSIDERKLTAEFVQQWGKIMFCHGYIASFVFDDTDDLAQERNRKKAIETTKRTSQHVFLARLLLYFMDVKGQTRQLAEGSAADLIQQFVSADKRKKLPKGYSLDWFSSLIRQVSAGGGKPSNRIISTMTQKNKPVVQLRELAGFKIKGLPPITILQLPR